MAIEARPPPPTVAGVWVADDTVVAIRVATGAAAAAGTALEPVPDAMVARGCAASTTVVAAGAAIVAPPPVSIAERLGGGGPDVVDGGVAPGPADAAARSYGGRAARRLSRRHRREVSRLGPLAPPQAITVEAGAGGGRPDGVHGTGGDRCSWHCRGQAPWLRGWG